MTWCSIHIRELTRCGWAVGMDAEDVESIATPERVAALLSRGLEAQVLR